MHSPWCTTVQKKNEAVTIVDLLNCLNKYSHRILSYYLTYNIQPQAKILFFKPGATFLFRYLEPIF